jgi:tetratricopeptide (TPR) repeat protein
MMAVVFAVAPADDPGFGEQMREAIRRHDGGDYPGAIKIYRSLLAEHPHEANVVYELSLSMMMGKSPPDEQIKFAEGEIASKAKQLPQLYASLASAYDEKKEYAKGEATLRKGLKLGPKSPDLHFNLGINLMMQERPKDALVPLQTAAQLAPGWSSAWRGVAMALDENGQTVDAFLARARFVAMEPTTERGKQAAKKLWPALMSGVSKQSDKIDVVVGKGADDMFFKLIAATRYAGHEKESDGQFFARALGEVADGAGSMKPGEFRKAILEFFAAAKQAGVMEALAWELRLAAGDADAGTWLGTHPTEEDAFLRFMRLKR